MNWINATEELPADYLQTVFIKGTYRKREIKTVGFYNQENKKFHTRDGMFSRKHVKWLKE